MKKINIAIIFIVIGIILSSGTVYALRVPMGGANRVMQAKLQLLMETLAEKELEGFEALRYMMDENSNFILALVLTQDGMRTYFYPKASMDVNHIYSGKVKFLKLKQGYEIKGRKYVLVVSGLGMPY